MSNIQSYNALIDRFHAFASGHFILKRFSHGQIEVSDLEKFGEYPFMHVVPSNVTYAKGMKTFSFQIVLADMPRDKEEKSEYQREVLSDLQRIAEDLVAEITNHRVLFGDLITVQNVSLEPFLEEFQHTLTGWTVSLDLLVPYYWDACSIPAEWNDFFESSTGGTGSILTFIDSITRDENGNVSLVNDEANPSPNYYYGTNDEGVRGWYLLTDEVGLTCETIGDCQTIIDIEAAIDALEEEIVLKADITSISAVGFSNDYDDLDNKPTIPTSLPPNGAAGGDLQGNYPNPTVHRVHGVDFQSGAPAVDETWVYVSTPLGPQPFQWQHSKLKASQVQNDSTVTGTDVDDALNTLETNKQDTLSSGSAVTQTLTPLANALYEIGAVGLYYAIAFIQVIRTNTIRMISNASGTSFQDASANLLMKIFGATGNVSIGNNIDSGFKIDVTGTARISGNLSAGNFQNSLAVDGTGTKFPSVDAVNNLSMIDRGKRVVSFFTDFFGNSLNIDGLIVNVSGGTISTTSISSVPQRTNQIGVHAYATGIVATNFAQHLSSGSATIYLGNGSWVFETSINILQLSTALERFRTFHGFAAFTGQSTESDGVFFTYEEGGIFNGTAASPNWQCVTSANSVRTLTTTSTAVTASAWNKLRIEVNAAGTSVAFFVNGTLVATHTTNIPLGSNSRYLLVKQGLYKATGLTSRNMYVDYLGYENIQTTPR